MLSLDEDDAKREWSFKTATLSSRQISLQRRPGTEGGPLAGITAACRVFAVAKAAGSPWATRISVGRARNNDIVLPHNSVSKLHAHFSTASSGEILLSDAGSRNGTRVNERRLGDSNPVPAVSGDVVTFGGVSLTLLDAAGLHDLVNRLFVSPSATSK